MFISLSHTFLLCIFLHLIEYLKVLFFYINKILLNNKSLNIYHKLFKKKTYYLNKLIYKQIIIF